MTTAQAVEAKLRGTLKKFTVTVYLKGERIIEVQTDEACRIDYNDKVRDVFLAFGYSDQNMFRMSEISAWTTTPNNERLPDQDVPLPAPASPI